MIARNAALNLTGHVAVVLAALLLVPVLIARLDAERFGFLALAWVLVGYFSLFDLGFGRALSRLVAESGRTARRHELGEFSRTALALTLLLGLVAGGVVAAVAEPFCTRLLRLPPMLHAEAIDALQVLAACLPVLMLSATLRGLLEAGQRFDLVNAIRSPVGILSFAAPLAATLWSTDLALLALALCFARIAGVFAYWVACARLYPGLARIGWPSWGPAREMAGYGAWLTVSDVIGPLLAYLDRFAIGAIVSVSAVAYYAAPHEVILRLSLISSAIAAALFPAIAAQAAERLPGLYGRGIKAVVAVMFPIALAILIFAPGWIDAWLGEDFARQGAAAAQLLTLAVSMNCIAHLPFTLLQARGRADVTAGVHIVELALYVVLLAVLVPRWGLVGAALACAIRGCVDLGLLLYLARRCVTRGPALGGSQVTAGALCLLVLLVALAPFSPPQKIAYFVLSLLALALISWLILLDPEDRHRLRVLLRMPAKKS